MYNIIVSYVVPISIIDHTIALNSETSHLFPKNGTARMAAF